MKALTWVGILMMAWVYIFALVLVQIVGKDASAYPVPEWDWGTDWRWSSVPAAMFTLFQAVMFVSAVTNVKVTATLHLLSM